MPKGLGWVWHIRAWYPGITMPTTPLPSNHRVTGALRNEGPIPNWKGPGGKKRTPYPSMAQAGAQAYASLSRHCPPLVLSFSFCKAKVLRA